MFFILNLYCAEPCFFIICYLVYTPPYDSVFVRMGNYWFLQVWWVHCCMWCIFEHRDQLKCLTPVCRCWYKDWPDIMSSRPLGGTSSRSCWRSSRHLYWTWDLVLPPSTPAWRQNGGRQEGCKGQWWDVHKLLVYVCFVYIGFKEHNPIWPFLLHQFFINIV